MYGAPAFFLGGLFLLMGVLGGGTPVSAATADVTLTQVTQTASSVTLGSSGVPQTYTATFRNGGSASETVLFDLELYNDTGAKVGQQFAERTLAAGQSSDLSLAVTFDSTMRTGTYTLKAAVFNSGWAGLAHWYDSAAKTSVLTPGAKVGAGDVVMQSISLDKTSVPQCNTILGTITWSTDQDISQPVLLDIEVWKTIGVKVDQNFWDDMVLVKGQPVTKVMRIIDGCNHPADYVVKVGVFKPGWAGVIHWYETAATFTVTDPNLPTTGVRGDVTLESSSVASSGGTSALTANFALSSGDYQKVLLDAELYDSAGTKVYQTYVSDVFFDKNSPRQTVTFTAAANLPPGTYTWKVAVFEGLWQKLLHWYDKAQTFAI